LALRINANGAIKEFISQALPESNEAAKSDVYRFHQAATCHRGYTLKQLLLNME